MPLDGTCRLPTYAASLERQNPEHGSVLATADDSCGECRFQAGVSRPGLGTRLKAAFRGLPGIGRHLGFAERAGASIETYRACKTAARNLRASVDEILQACSREQSAMALQSRNGRLPASGELSAAHASHVDEKPLLARGPGRRQAKPAKLMNAREARRLVGLAREEIVSHNHAVLVKSMFPTRGEADSLSRAMPFALKDRWGRENPHVRQFFENDAVLRGMACVGSETVTQVMTVADIDALCADSAALYEHLRNSLPEEVPLGDALMGLQIAPGPIEAQKQQLLDDVRARFAAMGERALPPARELATRQGWNEQLAQALPDADERPFRGLAQRLPLHPQLIEASQSMMDEVGAEIHWLHRGAYSAIAPAEADIARARANLDGHVTKLRAQAATLGVRYEERELRAWALEAALTQASMYQGIAEDDAAPKPLLDYAGRQLLGETGAVA